MNTQANGRNGHRTGLGSPAFLLCLLALVPATAPGAAEYYTEPPLYGMRPNPNAEVEMGPVGATGIMARIDRGVRVTVEKVEPNTPAHGKLTQGDVILGVNGAKLEGKNPLVVLGTALTEAEAADAVGGRLAVG